MKDLRDYLAWWEELAVLINKRAELIRQHQSTAIIDRRMVRLRTKITQFEINQVAA